MIPLEDFTDEDADGDDDGDDDGDGDGDDYGDGDDDDDGVVCSLFTLVMVDRSQTKSHFHLSIGQNNLWAPTGALYTIVRHDMSIQVPPNPRAVTLSTTYPVPQIIQTFTQPSTTTDNPLTM